MQVTEAVVPTGVQGHAMWESFALSKYKEVRLEHVVVLLCNKGHLTTGCMLCLICRSVPGLLPHRVCGSEQTLPRPWAPHDDHTS